MLQQHLSTVLADERERELARVAERRRVNDGSGLTEAPPRLSLRARVPMLRPARRDALRCSEASSTPISR